MQKTPLWSVSFVSLYRSRGQCRLRSKVASEEVGRVAFRMGRLVVQQDAARSMLVPSRWDLGIRQPSSRVVDEWGVLMVLRAQAVGEVHERAPNNGLRAHFFARLT